MFDKLGRLIKSIADSRGFSLMRILLTIFYILNIGAGTFLFTDSMGHYFRQGVSILMVAGGFLLLLRSFKKIFDERMRESIRRFSRKLGSAISEFIFKWTGVIIRKLGLERRRVKGEDERDFIFKERERGISRLRKMKNPHVWADADNAVRVRYIFTEYMFKRIRGGYRLVPKATPQKISRELAAEELEHTLFESYSAARYSGGREAIADSTVEELSELIDRKKKKKKPQN